VPYVKRKLGSNRLEPGPILGGHMAKYKIAWLPGDGIGQEVMEAAASCWTASA